MFMFQLFLTSNLAMMSSFSHSTPESNYAQKAILSSLLNEVPESVWDTAATSLLEKGVATVRLSTDIAGETSQLREIHSDAFGVAREILDRTLNSDLHDADDDSSLLPMIPPNADSAHVTGVHRAGGMSRYNAHREGIVFSDEGCFQIKSVGGRDILLSCGERPLSDMFWSLHGIANRVLLAIERKLELPPHDLLESENCEDGWFQRQLGPTEKSSQWHMKRFVETTMMDDADVDHMRTEMGEIITLPMHTDPSLISVVIHDSDSEVNVTNKALGLEYFHPHSKRWIEPEAHGHGIATIFVGSVLAYLTSNRFPAAKHRVVERLESNDNKPRRRRMAATLFVRPQPTALLRAPLPSPRLIELIERDEQKTNPHVGPKTAKKVAVKHPITFDAWLKRVARNYEKQKKRRMKQTKSTT